MLTVVDIERGVGGGVFNSAEAQENVPPPSKIYTYIFLVVFVEDVSRLVQFSICSYLAL